MGNVTVAKNRNNGGFFAKFVDNPLTWFDWIAFAALAAICFFTFQQGDILHTGGASITYLKGHILSFYDYNVDALGGCAYMPSSYILFAVWNIPLKLLGIVTDPTMSVPYIALMWYKLLPTFFYFGCGLFMYKIGKVIGLGNAKSKLCAYLFLSAPIGFFSQFIFGQYDSFTLLFMLAGVYFYFKNQNVKFALFFGIAITFKYFALLFFIPMLFIKVKKYWKLIGCLFIAILPIFLQIAVYYPSLGFREHVFGFVSSNYLGYTTLNNGFNSISIIVVLWVATVAAAYFTKPKDEKSLVSWIIFYLCLVVFYCFGLSFWHPQWLLFSVPFLLLGTMINKHFDTLLLIDAIMMILFVMFTVNLWPEHVDQYLFNLGALREIVPQNISESIPLRNLYLYKDRAMIYSLLSGLFLVSALVRNPKFAIEDYSAINHQYFSTARIRFIGGVLFFVVPATISILPSIVKYFGM